MNLIENVLHSDIAVAILRGKSPHEMVTIAMKNDLLKEAIVRLKILRKSDEYVAENFARFLEENLLQTEKNLIFLGQYISFLTVLFHVSKEKAITQLNKLSQELFNQHEIIPQVNSVFLTLK